ncbi:ATP-dependent endonuclease [Clostridium botulinum]|uniref:AAA family ATPase n=1 Tax=unclassified Clostridium TaxID=2614128 RepID=UPI0013C8F8D6|nr:MULTISPECIES: AAA family ATPase [unclassified Clostridium]MBY7008161.1 AAA family ATPase [Clostridium botulinum]NFH73557.1 ATP-dependent endonuclease [Clostridium botulinum]NFI01920.1 ATP-dependent endonuclease [Clostridium botulinum]NFI64026.1 ATP-dependent endonuclease [Clostridium botulinum]NFI82050.1 ATP-dependent endonuclease [Clostridium botulinum]
MKIAFVDIQNFRKLKKCHIDFSKETTLFVGANNSGKTSAMDALGKFLAKRSFVFNDITLSNHEAINNIGVEWEKEEALLPDTIVLWEDIVPILDIWLSVANNELQYVSHIIPTLDWKGGILGIRFILKPKDISKLFEEYREVYFAARTTESKNTTKVLSLWPKNLCDFIEKRFASIFVLKAYILDPSKVNNKIPQNTDFQMECFEQNPLNGLIRIDMVGAQRGFADPGSEKNGEKSIHSGGLSAQLRDYYDKHLDPEKTPTPEDFEVLQAIDSAKTIFNQNLKSKFNTAIEELEALGYPGVNDPQITIETKVNASETLNHDSAVQYSLGSDHNNDLKLPEKYNGLGYQNLVSMVFLLMRFRDDWMQVGKAKKTKEFQGKKMPPLHLVLLEEPEAHLHVQVQQVFIKKAYGVLRNNSFLKKHQDFSTQLVISSHSSNITHEMNFSDLRYFKRLQATEDCKVPTSEVVNLTDVFGKDDETNRFVTRYLKSTHCDLFFADALILVEGSAESMLIPHFIKKKYHELNQRYISILEINGRHSHRLKPLIEKLCLLTLAITDIDPADEEGYHKAQCPERNKGFISSNYAVTSWLLNEKSLDVLLDLPTNKKVVNFNCPYDYSIAIAYQTPQKILFDSKEVEALSSTFEDSLIYANLELFKNHNGDGIFQIANSVINNSKTFEELHLALYSKLREGSAGKAGFALDLIYSIEPEELIVPPYIDEGLNWLQEQLKQEVSNC